MLTPGDWPILDYDDDPTDGLSGFFLAMGGDVTLPRVVVLAFLGSAVARHAEAEGAEQIHSMDMITASYPLYRITRGDAAVGLVEVPVGAAAATIVADDLFLRGLRAAVAVGSCGALRPFEEGEFIVPARALRDEGTSYHYLPPSDWVDTDPLVSKACLSAIAGRGHPATSASAWTTDGLFRETEQMVERRRDQGCAVVDMECAALASAAQFRGVQYGQILFAADSLAGDAYDPRDWGVDSHEVALRMAIDAAFDVEASL